MLPQFTLRFHKDTPQEVMEAAKRELEEGRSYPLMYNDDVLVPGVQEAFGVSRELAERYVPLGCGEIELDHYSFGSPNGSLNMLKILETTMHGGYDPIMKWHKAPQTKRLDECETFEAFYSLYKDNLRQYIHAQALFEKYEYEITGRIHPFMFCSMLYDGCLEKGRAFFSGGCEHLGGTLELYGGINAANSLAAIKQLVFDERKITAKEMMDALADNFTRHELARKMMMDVPKWGNDNFIVSLQTYGHLASVGRAAAHEMYVQGDGGFFPSKQKTGGVSRLFWPEKGPLGIACRYSITSGETGVPLNGQRGLDTTGKPW